MGSGKPREETREADMATSGHPRQELELAPEDRGKALEALTGK